MASKVTVYVSNTTSSADARKRQQHILGVLSSLKIDHETIDVSASRDDLLKMREIANDQTALAPQLALGDKYIGNYDQFAEAVEDKSLEKFLLLE